MEIESITCECCGLTEDCTQHYISRIKANFGGKWLCGLCSEAVNDEFSGTWKKKKKKKKTNTTLEEAFNAHVSFCGKYKANPAELVADGMKQMLRRRSGELTTPAKSNKFAKSNST